MSGQSSAFEQFKLKKDNFIKFLKDIVDKYDIGDINIHESITLQQGLLMLESIDEGTCIGYIGMHLLKYEGYEGLVVNVKLSEFGMNEILSDDEKNKITRYIEFFNKCAKSQ